MSAVQTKAHAALAAAMNNRKTETLTVRLNPEVKATLRRVAAREHRSLANMLEVMIRDWSDVHKSARSTPFQTADRDSTESAVDD